MRSHNQTGRSRSSVKVSDMSKLMSISSGRPVGFWLQSPKGRWTVDGVTADPELHVAVLVPTWEDGEICFGDDHKVVDQCKHLVDTHGLFGKPQPGYNKATSVTVLDSAGRIGTFTGTSWAAHWAVMGLLGPYQLQQGRAFPVCALKAKERGDQYGNIDGVFDIVDWAPRSKFDAILGPAPESKPAITAPESKPEPAVKRSSSEIIGDEIPFSWVAAFLVPIALMVSAHVV